MAIGDAPCVRASDLCSQHLQRPDQVGEGALNCLRLPESEVGDDLRRSDRDVAIGAPHLAYSLGYIPGAVT